MAQNRHRKAGLCQQRFQRRTDRPVGSLHTPWLYCSLGRKREEFICPCHLGVFAPDGKLLGGPPPRDMDRLETKVENGVLKTQYQFFRQLTRNKEELA